MTVLEYVAITAAGLREIVNPAHPIDPAAAYELSIIDDRRPRIADLESRLGQRNWRMDDIGTPMRAQLDLYRQTVHIAEERLLDLYGMPRRPSTPVDYRDAADIAHADDPAYDQCPGCDHWWPLTDMSVNRSGDNICPDCVFSWSAYPDHR